MSTEGVAPILGELLAAEETFLQVVMKGQSLLDPFGASGVTCDLINRCAVEDSWTLAELRALLSLSRLQCLQRGPLKRDSEPPDCRRILPGTLRYSFLCSFVVRR